MGYSEEMDDLRRDNTEKAPGLAEPPPPIRQPNPEPCWQVPMLLDLRGGLAPVPQNLTPNPSRGTP